MHSIEYLGIDEKATIKATKIILNHYRPLMRLLNEPISQRLTATYTFTPRNKQIQTHNNYIDKQLDKKNKALKMAQEIEQAINTITSDKQRQLLIKKYCESNQLKDLSIMYELKTFDGSYYRLLNRALLAFGASYNNGELLAFDKKSPLYTLVFGNG